MHTEWVFSEPSSGHVGRHSLQLIDQGTREQLEAQKAHILLFSSCHAPPFETMRSNRTANHVVEEGC